MEIIISSQNPLIKEINALKEKKYREARKQFFIEGLRFFEEALRERVEIIKVVIAESFLSNSDWRIAAVRSQLDSLDTSVVSDKLFKTMSDTESPQGILAVVAQHKRSLDSLPLKGNRLVLLEQLQDPGNLGTIVRTADAAGFNGIVLTRGCVDPYNPKVLRSTMGSIFRVPIYTGAELEEAARLLKKYGVRIFAAHLEGSENIYELDTADDIAFIIGNEASGISEKSIALADKLIRIPMAGEAESLNASVAAAVLMYESLRQRLVDKIK